MQKKHLCQFSKRAACIALAALMTMSTIITGCGIQDITADALEDGHDHSHGIVAAQTVSIRETLAGSLDDSYAEQAGKLSDAYWDSDVPATEKDVIYEYAVNEDVLVVVDKDGNAVEYTSDYETGSSVDLDSVNTSTVENDYDEYGLRETPHEVRIMYTTVDKDHITESDITSMWDDNYEAFISNIMLTQHVYEVDKYDDCYVAFVNFSALNGTDGQIIAADFTRGTERHPVDMSDQVVLDKENGVLYLPKAWYFAGDGTEVSLDLTAQVMVAVDTQNEANTDEYGNLLSHISVTVENEAGRDIAIGNGMYETMAYDYAILPLFEAGTVDGIRKDDIEVYVNGSAEPLDPSELGYNPDDGMLTINKIAMSVTEVRIVFPKKGFFASAADMFSIGKASAAGESDYLSNIMNNGMTPIYNVSKYASTHDMEQAVLHPNIDISKLTVGDVLAYFTMGTYGARYTATYQDMWNRGADKFVYTSNFLGDRTRSDTYWMMVGNMGVSLQTDYSLGKKDNYGFIIELPFNSNFKPQNAKNPVVVKTDGNKLRVGDKVNFGYQEDWQWIDLSADYTVGGESGIYYSHSIPGQCSHTADSTYMDGSGTEVTGFICRHEVAENFSCNCGKNGDESCPECKQYRTAHGLTKCDRNCPHCKEGKCKKCAGTCEQFRLQYNLDYCTNGCKQCMSGECESCAETIFRCSSCYCAECQQFRNENDLDFCNENCPHCSAGACPGCSTSWIGGEQQDFEASATVRILAMGSDYLIIGLAQLDSGDCQRGTSVLKVKTIVEVKIDKVGSQTENPSNPMNQATTNNPCYGDTSDAEYTVYRDANCTDAVGTIKANDEEKLLLPPGNYYVKETLAPLGYYMDTEVHMVNFNTNMTWETSDQPMWDPFTLTVAQKNIENRGTAGVTVGDVGPLENIQFDVYYYKGEYTSIASLPTADAHAVFKTDANGRLRFASRYLVPGQTWKYKDQNGLLFIPMGTIMIREKTPIDGLLISNNYGMLFTLTDKSDKTSDDVTNMNYHGDIVTYEGSSGVASTENRVGGTYQNSVAKGGVTVSKADQDWNAAREQGDATLSGAQFTLYNRSAAQVYYKGNFYEPGAVMDVLTESYDANTGLYSATTGPNVLEYGTYELVETAAPTGYNLADWSRRFTIRQNGQMHNFTQAASADTSSGLNFYHQWCRDAVMRGGVTIGKVDRETKQYISLGAAELGGTGFQIINRSAHAVRVNGKDYNPGQVIMNLSTSSANGAYTCTTGNYVLPYGTYEIKETGSSLGYLFDSTSASQTKTFSIRQHGQMADLTGQNDAFHNQVQREDWYFTKKYDDTGERMAKSAWVVSSVTTGETHIIVTDENGKYDSEQAKHSTRPNANDPDSPISNGAIGINGSGEYYVKDSSKLDYDAGTWFTGLRPEITQWASDGRSYTVKGGTGTIVPVNDDLRAYPYDTYIVRELASDVNEGYNLVTFTVTLKRYNDDPNSNGIKLDYGTVDDQVNGTTAMYTNLYYNDTGFVEDAKSAPAKNGLVVTDVVTVAGMNVGHDYTLRGSLHLLDENGKDLGEVATSNVTFTGVSLGQVKMDFTVNAEGWEGKSLVAFEELVSGNFVVSYERDINNEDQKVWLSGITGTRADKVYTSAKAGTSVTVTDEVDYVNLEVGAAHVITMTLVDQATGAVLKDIDGNDITSDTWFIPGTNNGTETVSVTFSQPEGFAGTTAVVYEEISKGDGNLYGWHKNLNDANQTVRFIDMVDTYAVNGSSYTKEISADVNQSVYECVKLADLRNDTTYRLEGSLYWLDDDGVARAVLNADGSPMVIIVDNPSAQEAMLFEGIDATELGGRDLVVYQMLYGRKNGSDEWEVAFEHCYPDDLDQIVHVPAIDTTLLSYTKGIHHDDAGQVTQVDRVDYKNLVPGQRYTLNGVLHIREDAETADGFEAVDMGDSGIKASVTFTPEAKDGYVDLTFQYDGTSLDGKVVVAFEELWTSENREGASGWEQFFRSKAGAGNRRVAHHQDINDTIQSLGFARITGTELIGEGIYTKIVDGVITLVETLNWDGLIPGFDYDVDEVFDEASEWAKILISTNGMFTPETVKGSITVSTTEDVQSRVHKNVLLAHDNMLLTDVIHYEGLIPGMKYMLNSRLMIKNEDGTIEEEPLVTLDGGFIPESVNGTLRVNFLFDATGLAGKDIVAYERITQDGVLVAAHEDPNDNLQTVKFPKVETLFTGKDYSGTATEPIKTIEFNTYSGHQDVFGVSQIQVDSVDIVDTVTVSNLIPGLTYKVKGEVHLKGNYNELHDFIETDSDIGKLYCTAEATFTPDRSTETLQLTYHILPIGINKADLVAFEYVFIDDEVIGMHADIKDEQQTVTIIGKDISSKLDTVLTATEDVITNNIYDDAASEGTEPLADGAYKNVEYYAFGSHRDKLIHLNDTIEYTGLVVGSEYTLKGEVHIRNRYGADMGTIAYGNDIVFRPEAETGTLTMAFTVDPSQLPSESELDDMNIGLVAFEYLYENGELVAKHAKIRDADQTVTVMLKEITAEIDTVLTSDKAVISNNPYEDKTDGGSGTVDTGTQTEGTTDEGTQTEGTADEGVQAMDMADSGTQTEGTETEDTETDDKGTQTDPTGPVKALEYYTFAGHADEPITLTDAVSYINAIVGTEYTLKGEIHVLNKYGADIGVIAKGEDIKFTPTAPTGELSMKFTVDPKKLPTINEMNGADVRLIAFEYLYEGDKLVDEHADIEDADQTVTVAQKEVAIELDTLLSGTEAIVTNNPSGTKPADKPATDEPGMTDESKEPSTEESNESADESSEATDESSEATDESEATGESSEAADESKATDESEATDESSESTDKSDESADGSDETTDGTDNTDDEGTEAIKTIEYYTYAGHDDVLIDLTDTISYNNVITGTEYTLKGELRIRNRYGNDVGVLATGEDVTFTPEAPAGSTVMKFTVDPKDMPADASDLVAYEYLYEGDKLVAWHTDLADADQSVTILIKEDEISIDTEMRGTRVDKSKAEADAEAKTEEPTKSVEFWEYEETSRFGKTTRWTDLITLTDIVAYHNLTPGQTYMLKGEVHMKGRFGIDLGNIGIDESVTFKPETADGTIDVVFTVDPMEIQDAELVAYEYLYEVNRDAEDPDVLIENLIASHADIADEGQTVTIAKHVEPEPDPEPSIMDTILLGGTTEDADLSDGCSHLKDIKNHKVIELNRKREVDKKGNTNVTYDKVTLTDVVVYTDLEPDVEYEIRGEVHIRDVYNRDMGKVSETRVKFKPNAYEGQIEVTFEIDPTGINVSNLVAFEYLYRDGKLVATHDCIYDKDQTVTLVAKGNICGCDDPDCKHKDELDHCTKPGCCDDSDCCKDCDECKPAKNPCGCDDPDCKHKDEKNHCVNNPGCCDDSDCCKNCTTCVHKNLCGCTDPNCKHKYEKDHCVNNPGCCDDTGCCKDCKDCVKKPVKNPCGCTDPNCKHKTEVNHCVNNPGCCDDSTCCKNCTECKSKTATTKNPCGCDDPNCKHKNQTNYCINNPGCCDGDGCCTNCTTCKKKGTTTNPTPTPGPDGTTTTKPSKNPVQNIINTVKTGENTFLLMTLVGLTIMSGGAYFFVKTSSGQKALDKLRKKLSQLFGRK